MIFLCFGEKNILNIEGTIFIRTFFNDWEKLTKINFIYCSNSEINSFIDYLV